MAWDSTTGLNLRLIESQYSRASTLTLRWSRPSWQMSACTGAVGVGQRVEGCWRFTCAPSSRPPTPRPRSRSRPTTLPIDEP